jgi:energy-coupling factor transport system ATP-binding protein
MGESIMAIKLNHLFHIYAQKTPFQFEALHDVNLIIQEHSFTAIIGHTGSGKSTLIQHFNALLLPTSGSLEVNGITIEANRLPKHVKKIRQYAGVVFQFPEAQLFEETVEQDVMFGPLNFGLSKDQAKRRARLALAQVGLNETFLPRSPFELSGGERRRVAIAGILAMQPKVLILDEPTAGLDAQGATLLMELFTNLHREGMTIMLVTHDMDLVLTYATDVIVMDQGKVTAQSDPETLFYGDMHVNIEKPQLVKLVQACLLQGMPLPLQRYRTLEHFMKDVKVITP